MTKLQWKDMEDWIDILIEKLIDESIWYNL